MTFPTIPTVAAGRVLFTNQADTSQTRTFPSLSSLTKNSGDLLLAIIVTYQSSTNPQFSSWGGGFTEISDQGTSSTLGIGVAWKISDGTETGTFTVTQAATIAGHASMCLLSIPGAHGTTAPEVGTIANGTSAAADPGSFNPSGWDVEDTLWIAVDGNGMTSGTGSWAACGAGTLTNYSGQADSNTTDSSTVGQTEIAVSFRQNAAASEDRGAVSTHDLSNARNSAIIIAVRPIAVTTVTVNQVTETDTAQAFGKQKIKALAQALETDTAKAVTPARVYPLVQSTEADTAGAITLARAYPLAQAAETDTAGVISPARIYQLALATETDTAGEITRGAAQTVVALAQAAETDTAQAFGKTKVLALVQVVETDTAGVISPARIYQLALATETDTAGAVTPARVRALAQVLEANTAGAITPARVRALAQAVETDTAQAFAARKVREFGLAIETDTAGQITLAGGPQVVALGQSVENDTAGAITVQVAPVRPTVPLQFTAAFFRAKYEKQKLPKRGRRDDELDENELPESWKVTTGNKIKPGERETATLAMAAYAAEAIAERELAARKISIADDDAEFMEHW